MLRMRFNCSSVGCVLCGCTDVETHHVWSLSMVQRVEVADAALAFSESAGLVTSSKLGWLKEAKRPKINERVYCWVYAGLVYHTWTARNAFIFRQEVAAAHVHSDLLKKELQARLQKKVSSKDAGRCRDLFDRVCS